MTGTFTDNSPAIVVTKPGRGRTVYCAFLPSLTYYRPAIPKRPVDRGASDDAMIHFLPTDFDVTCATLIASAARDLELPVLCSEPLVESTVIESKHGTVIPLVNWSGRAVGNLELSIGVEVPNGKATLASGTPVKITSKGLRTTATLALDAADALIFRK